MIGKNGKERLVYAYSLLQDRYDEHMRAAGYKDFERGERESAAELLLPIGASAYTLWVLFSIM